jgi:hypothetical protein
MLGERGGEALLALGFVGELRGRMAEVVALHEVRLGREGHQRLRGVLDALDRDARVRLVDELDEGASTRRERDSPIMASESSERSIFTMSGRSRTIRSKFECAMPKSSIATDTPSAR